MSSCELPGAMDADARTAGSSQADGVDNRLPHRREDAVYRTEYRKYLGPPASMEQ